MCVRFTAKFNMEALKIMISQDIPSKYLLSERDHGFSLQMARKKKEKQTPPRTNGWNLKMGVLLEAEIPNLETSIF